MGHLPSSPAGIINDRSFRWNNNVWNASSTTYTFPRPLLLWVITFHWNKSPFINTQSVSNELHHLHLQGRVWFCIGNLPFSTWLAFKLQIWYIGYVYYLLGNLGYNCHLLESRKPSWMNTTYLPIHTACKIQHLCSFCSFCNHVSSLDTV